jgi:Skp family chaperone for outer membrane proteins
MPSERTKVYLDELEDRFENRDKFYKELQNELRKKKANSQREISGRNDNG